jgi:hypothetical protein
MYYICGLWPPDNTSCTFITWYQSPGLGLIFSDAQLVRDSGRRLPTPAAAANLWFWPPLGAFSILWCAVWWLPRLVIYSRARSQQEAAPVPPLPDLLEAEIDRPPRWLRSIAPPPAGGCPWSRPDLRWRLPLVMPLPSGGDRPPPVEAAPGCAPISAGGCSWSDPRLRFFHLQQEAAPVSARSPNRRPLSVVLRPSSSCQVPETGFHRDFDLVDRLTPECE